MFGENMKIGDKLKKGYNMLEKGQYEGGYIFLEAVADMYMLDEIEDIIYGNLANFVAVMEPDKAVKDLNQWLKIVLLDVRYGKLMLFPGDLLENLVKLLNQLPTVEQNILTQSFMEGSIPKLKYMDGEFFMIQNDYSKNMKFLVKVVNGAVTPLDFDIDDFEIDRKNKRIKFNYIKGSKATMSIKTDGTDKKIIEPEGKEN